MLKKVTFLLTITLLSACTGRGDSSNNNSDNNTLEYNNNNTPIGWVLVGEANISGAETASPILKFYDHIPYVAFLDAPSSTSKIRVMKYVAATDTWEDVGGSGFSAGSSKLAFEINSSNGDLYVAYSDGTAAGKLTVRKFDGASWSDVGGVTGISNDAVEHVAITIKSGTTPYVAYYDTDVGTAAVVIQKYTGGSWSVVTGGLAEDADAVSLASDTNNVYLATVITSSGLINIKQYNASDTESSIAYPVANQAKDLSIFVKGNYLYVTNIDLDNADKVALRRYNTTSPAWSNVGASAYISDGAAGVPSLYVESNGVSDDVAYVAYQDQTVSNKASVKVCMDNAIIDCADLGELGFSSTAITNISASYDDDHPYVTYVDTTTNGIEIRKY